LVPKESVDEFKKKIDQELKKEQNKNMILLEREIRKKERAEKIHQNYLELRRQEIQLKKNENIIQKNNFAKESENLVRYFCYRLSIIM